MIPNITRGGSTARLVRYLVGSGRGNEHVSPHIVAGSPELLLGVGHRELARSDARVIGEFLDEPMRAFNVEVTRPVKDKDGRATGERKAAHVWHASLSLSPVDQALGDATWHEAAEQFVTRMGFIGNSDRGEVRWVAIHHGTSANGNDHIHIVVNLVREDGTIAGTHKDFGRAQAATRQLDRAYGLTGPEGPKRGAGERGIKKGELESDLRRGLDVGDNGETPENGTRRRLEILVRACAAAAEHEHEFVAGLRAEGVLVSPVRYDKTSPERITGYRVALRGSDGEPGPWYGGGKLSRELTLPRLRQAWTPASDQEINEAWRTSGAGPGTPFGSHAGSVEELQQVAAELDALETRLRQVPSDEAGTWAQVARETAGALAALSLRVQQPGQIRKAARNIARSAQIRAKASRSRRWRALPPTRRLTRLITSADGRSRSTIVMVTRILDLVRALRDMHAAAGDADRAKQLDSLANQVATHEQDRRSRTERGPHAVVSHARRPATHQQRPPDRQDQSRDDAGY